MKTASSWIVKAICILGLLGLASPAYAETDGGNRVVYLPVVSSSSSPRPAGQVPSRSLGWLEYLNAYRSLSRLPMLTENASWSRGGHDHAVYTVKTGVLAHAEDTNSPYYTPDGNTAAQNSNVMAYLTDRPRAIPMPSTSGWQGRSMRLGCSTRA